MLLNIIHLWMHGLNIVSIVMCVTENRKFERYTALYNYDCPESEMVFAKDTIRSKIDCVQLCSQTASCVSVFYVPGTCHGCSVVYTDQDLASLLKVTGTVYYKTAAPAPALDFSLGRTGYKVTDKATFDDAVTACQLWGGSPVIANTPDEHTFLRDTLEARSADFVFIGLYQPSNTDWVWQASGEVLQGSFDADWNPGEPDGGMISNCVAINPWFSYKWSDVSCLWRLQMLCEISL